jgi:ABC-type branched-subunit amino acid transport system permease subunit
VAVLLVMATIVMQGVIEPLRYVRVFMPFTWFGGPNGIDGDPERWMIMTGSPQWYCLYLVALCVLGVLVAALHDREQPRGTLLKAAGATAVVAVALGSLSMTMGAQEELVNPLPSPAAE